MKVEDPSPAPCVVDNIENNEAYVDLLIALPLHSKNPEGGVEAPKVNIVPTGIPDAKPPQADPL